MFLAESQESKSISEAKKLLVDKLNFTPEQADERIRKDLRDGIPALRTKEGGKFVLGCTRLFFVDKQLVDATKLDDMNEIITILVDDKSLYEKFDRNFNNLPFKDLARQFEQVRKDKLEKDKKEQETRNIDNRQNFRRPSNYDIIRIASFEEAKKFHKYTDWCITHMPRMWISYTSDDKNTVYFCVRKDVATIERPQNGRMLDSYDLSLISVIVGIDGGLRFCTCRYNHDYAPDNMADHMLSTGELSKLLHVDFYKAFPSKEEETTKSIKEALKVFKETGDFKECRKVLSTVFVYVGEPSSNGMLIPVSTGNLEFNVLKVLDNQGNHKYLFEEPALDIDGFKNGSCIIYKPVDGYTPDDYAEAEDEDGSEETYQDEFGYNINILREDGTFVFKEDLKDVSWNHAQNILRASGGKGTAFIVSDKKWYCIKHEKALPIDPKADDCRILDILYMQKYNLARVTASVNRRHCIFLMNSEGSRITDFFSDIRTLGDNYGCFSGHTYNGDRYLIDSQTGKTINSTPLRAVNRTDETSNYLLAITDFSQESRGTYNTLIKVEKRGSEKSFKILPYSRRMCVQGGEEDYCLDYGDYDIHITTDTGKEWVEKDGKVLNIKVPWKDLKSDF